MKRKVTIRPESWPVRGGVFRISRGSRTHAQPIVVAIAEGAAHGHGECVAYARYGETIDSVVATIEALRSELEDGLSRAEIAARLPAGGARSAIDCALWDLEAKLSGHPVWMLAGLEKPQPLITAFTLAVDTPEATALAAQEQATRPLLKLKLAGDGQDLARVAAVRTEAPEARIIVDANEGWQRHDYESLVPEFVHLDVALIEQPFHADSDAILAELPHPIPICADESCHTSDDLPRLTELYDFINIKLHKAGGLTEALHLKKAALAHGFSIMVGCMLATSLEMAPAILVAQGAEYVDIDGPLLLAKDREPGLHFEGSRVYPAPPELWG